MDPLLHLRITAGYANKPAVLRNVELSIEPGEILGLAGGSGEGKSSLILAILGLLPLKRGTCEGEIFFQGRDLLKLNARDLRQVRGKEIGLVPQSPVTSLNPNLRLGVQLKEAWRAHKSGEPAWQPLLQSVSLPAEESFLRLYPRQLSVGMAQRFLIALAILHDPPLLLADEPTSALDLITQSEILALFRRLNAERNIAMLYVSHDLASMASLCHRVAVLHKGEIVECAGASEIFESPRHEYTKRLVNSIPQASNPLAQIPNAAG